MKCHDYYCLLLGMTSCDLDAKSSVCRPQAAMTLQCQSVATRPAGSAPGPTNTIASLAKFEQNTNDKLKAWHHVDHHQITSITITCRPATTGSGHCSNRRQLNSSRKGRPDSHARVQIVQAGRGPGGWTSRRALAPGLPV
jgi:hypothetical protein